MIMLARTASAQKLTGYHQYPQFRTMSGLPGSSFPVTPLGEVDGTGAIAISTPVAYSLGNLRFVVGGMAVSFNGSRFLRQQRRGKDVVEGNGTGQALAGIGLGRYGNLTVAGLFLSGEGDSAFNFHWTPPQSRASQVTYAVGVQDIRGRGGASGTGQPGDGDSSRSFYGVVTGRYANDTYVSLGLGTHRFGRPFGNVSTRLARGAKVYAEYDAFNVNLGAAYIVPLGRSERRPSLTLNVGLIRTRYPAISASIAF